MRYDEMDEASREEVEQGISAAFANVADRLWCEVRDAAICAEPDREAVYGKVRAAGAVAEIEDLYRFNNLTAEDIMEAVGNVSPEAHADPATYEPVIAKLAAECSDGHLPDKDEVLASLNGMKRGLPLSPEAQAIKEALEQGRDLYNVETGEFCFLWNDLGSIASTDVPLDDPRLMDAIASDGFDFYEDMVGAPNRTAYIIESNESRLEDGDGLPNPENPAFDERDEVFERMASEDGWGDASKERVLAAMEGAGLLRGVDAPSQRFEADVDKAVSDAVKATVGKMEFSDEVMEEPGALVFHSRIEEVPAAVFATYMVEKRALCEFVAVDVEDAQGGVRHFNVHLDEGERDSLLERMDGFCRERFGMDIRALGEDLAAKPDHGTGAHALEPVNDLEQIAADASRACDMAQEAPQGEAPATDSPDL